MYQNNTLTWLQPNSVEYNLVELKNKKYFTVPFIIKVDKGVTMVKDISLGYKTP